MRLGLGIVLRFVRYIWSSVDEGSKNVRPSKRQVTMCGQAFLTIMVTSGLGAVLAAARQANSDAMRRTPHANMSAESQPHLICSMDPSESRVSLGAASTSSSLSKRHPRAASQLDAAAADLVKHHLQRANLPALPLSRPQLQSLSLESLQLPQLPVQAAPLTACKLPYIAPIARSPSFSDWV